ncbi:MAG TPA: metallophosphoesterase, partial [Flavisolibacter sp.]|nr:metallophosphoesterase [Flavisolibacter sp.]
LTKYLAAGGHAINPATGERELGFPNSDESNTADGYRRVSYFERGAIYWNFGGVRVHGEIFKKYQSLGEVTGSLGYPVSSNMRRGQLTVCYFEFGCICQASFLQGPLVINYDFPQTGNPFLASAGTSDPLSRQLSLKVTIGQAQKIAIERSGIDIIREVTGSLFKLQPVVQRGSASALPGLQAAGSIQSIPIPIGIDFFLLKGSFSLAAGASLKDRTLYNICFEEPENGLQVVAPHALYAKKDVSNFGLMQATDLHVSRRVEGMRGALSRKGLEEGVREFVNWNDKFRDLVKYANHLHSIGELDMILATGDLVDFIFERGDNRKGGGNFTFFRDIILGRAPYGDKNIFLPNKELEHEELRVPIYTTLGNHDYRPNPYEWYADVDAGDMGGWDFIPGGLWNEDVSSYTGLNITENEIKSLQGSKPRLDMYAAAESLKADPHALDYYRRYINRDLNYVINIGVNKIIVIDSKWDLGILDVSAKTILKVVVGHLTENERDLMSVNPDSVGFEDAEIDVVRSALTGSSREGVVILGVHAPIINPKGNEYPHYFRQTEHPTAAKELMSGYLIRRDSLKFSQNLGATNRDETFPDWIRTGSLNFKKQDPGNLLDFGTSRGRISDLIKLCLGQGVARPVDLILCGHGHKMVEFRFGWNDEENFFRFYHEHYTENPGEYYNAFYNDLEIVNAAFSPPLIYAKEKKRVRVFVKDGAALNQKPWKIVDHQDGHYWKEWWQVEVPPYNNTLNKSSNPKNWWLQHRPLMMQTGALGSSGNNRKDPSVNKEIPEPNFSGVRLVTVKNNVIAKMRYLLMADIRKHNFKLPWEPSRSLTPDVHKPVERLK